MNGMTIAFWVLFALWAILLFSRLRKEAPKGDNHVHDITFDALILAILCVMAFVPDAGYITIVPGVSLTLMHLPVLIGAYRKGWKRGLLYGIAFGVTSWIQALTNPIGFNAFFVYPWISVLPRAVWGFLAGFFFSLVRKNPKLYANPLGIGVLSFGLTILHTGLVFGDLFLFYWNEMVALFTSSDPAGAGIAFTSAGIIGLGMLGEAIVAALLTPAVGKALAKAASREE